MPKIITRPDTARNQKEKEKFTRHLDCLVFPVLYQRRQYHEN